MKRFIPAIAFSLVAAAMALQVFAPAGRLTERAPVVFDDVEGFSRTEVAAEESGFGVLPADTEIRRAVYSSGGNTFVVTAVVSGSSRSSIHRPELCLPSQGYEMSSPRDLLIDGVGWRAMSVSGGGVPSRFAYTFFNQAGYRTTSHVARIFRDVLDRSFLGRIDRWTMVTVSAQKVSERDLRSFLGRLREAVR